MTKTPRKPRALEITLGELETDERGFPGAVIVGDVAGLAIRVVSPTEINISNLSETPVLLNGVAYRVSVTYKHGDRYHTGADSWQNDTGAAYIRRIDWKDSTSAALDKLFRACELAIAAFCGAYPNALAIAGVARKRQQLATMRGELAELESLAMVKRGEIDKLARELDS